MKYAVLPSIAKLAADFAAMPALQRSYDALVHGAPRKQAAAR